MTKLLNTNKEAYHIAHIPGSNKDGLYHVCVQVINSLFYDQFTLAEKINDKCATNIKALKKSLLWDLLVSAESLEEAQAYVESQLLGQSSKHHPFLLNPIFESYKLIQTKELILNEA